MQLVEELSIKEIINRIKNYDSFEAVPPDHSFHIKIRDYVPFVCAAIHAGGNSRENKLCYLPGPRAAQELSCALGKKSTATESP